MKMLLLSYLSQGSETEDTLGCRHGLFSSRYPELSGPLTASASKSTKLSEWPLLQMESFISGLGVVAGSQYGRAQEASMLDSSVLRSALAAVGPLLPPQPGFLPTSPPPMPSTPLHPPPPPPSHPRFRKTRIHGFSQDLIPTLPPRSTQSHPFFARIQVAVETVNSDASSCGPIKPPKGSAD